MPTWTNQIPARPNEYGYTIRRTPPDHPIRGVCTCPDMIGCYTHYFGGRTVPCEFDPGDPEAGIPLHPCKACAENMPRRWHGYLSAWDPSTRDHFIFEITESAARYFEEYRASNGTLLGCSFAASRPKRRKNARIEVTCKPIDLTKIRLPAAPNIERAMAVIWGVPYDAPKTAEIVHQTKTIDLDLSRLHAQQINPADGNGRPKPTKAHA